MHTAARADHVQPHLTTETLHGVVDRVTFTNPENGWSVLRVQPVNSPLADSQTVIVHQTNVFAGATMRFRGCWHSHPQFGKQFKAAEAVETKPATAAALEKYLGSGLIKGLGPKTAKKIVDHFGEKTLSIFEENIEGLTAVPGIAKKKLTMIKEAWEEHRAIRDVMIFLQSHGISTLFAVKIFKLYGDASIQLVTENPYRLASDIYGIGFLSADKVALSIGIAEDSPLRIKAGIQHVLSASKDFGHCYLTQKQIQVQVDELLGFLVGQRLVELLEDMRVAGLLMVRSLANEDGVVEACYYSKALYFDELAIAKRLKELSGSIQLDPARLSSWIERYCKAKNVSLSDEQGEAVAGVATKMFSVLTGGPGCGKTTTTLVLVKLLEAMGLRVLLAAPTGRAAQRMGEVIGQEAVTIHRLLEWKGGSFQKNEDNPLDTNFLIIDECSMLDVSLAAALLKAVREGCQVLFIGDADQLPAVGAGNVLKDIIASLAVPIFRLTQIFRQAQASLIIQNAHQINRGNTPQIDSPFNRPELWQQKVDSLFIDSDEATQEQLAFIAKVKKYHDLKANLTDEQLYQFRAEDTRNPYETEIVIPKKFQHANIEEIARAGSGVQELKAVLKDVHPWSSLHYGISATNVIRQLYTHWIPKYHPGAEIQILSPMTRGSLGTGNLNKIVQGAANPYADNKNQVQIGERVFREGDRVIHRRNNYDLEVFNGDIGIIKKIDLVESTCLISFFPDGRVVQYDKEQMLELDLAYAITIHKSQGSEFGIVIIPVFTQHFKMLYRNLIYTGLTRAKKLAVFVGSRRALAMAVRQQDTSKRQTALAELLAA